jgi:hypothetical protein
MSKKIIITIGVIVVLSLGITSNVFAQGTSGFWTPGDPLVPCGTSTTLPCTRCDLFKLLRNIVDFLLIGLMPPVAILLFIVGGLMIILGGANPGMISRGKSIFWSTFIGVLIILSAWLITNTLIQSIASSQGTWWQFTCTETIVQPTPGPGPVDCNNLPALASQNNVPFPRTNSPSLAQMMTCIESNPTIPGLINPVQIFTYEQTNDACNYTRGQAICGSCAHSLDSCHYGGSTGTSGAEAVDYNAIDSSQAGEQALFNAINALRSSCNIGFVLFEQTNGGWHTHVSTATCSGN